MKVVKISNDKQLRDYNSPLEYCARCGQYYEHGHCGCDHY